MRSRIIVLLAVCCDIAAAGPLRHNGARAQHHNVARFLNHTEIPSMPAAIAISTPIPITSSSIIPLIAASPETSAFAITSSTIAAATTLTTNVAFSSSPSANSLSTSMPSQVQSASSILPSIMSTTGNGVTFVSSSAPVYGGNSVSESQQSAVVQPAMTLSRLFNIGSSPLDGLQPSTTALSFTSTPSFSLALSTPTTSDVQYTSHILKVASTSSSSFLVNQASSSEAPLLSSSSTAPVQASSSSATLMTATYLAAASQTPSPVVVPVPISSGLVQVLGAGGDAADEFAPVTLDTGSPAPTGTAKYPTAEGGNIAMANDYNDVYKTLNEDTPCNPGDPSQAYVCVLGEMAECQSDGQYVLKSCPRGQSCYALPKPSGTTGIVVQCAIPSIASSILAGLSSSTAVPVAATSQPAQILQADEDFSQATQSVSVQNPVHSVTSSRSAEAIIQSQTTALAPSVIAVAATASQDQDSDRVDKTAVSLGTSSTSAPSSLQGQSQALSPSVTAVTTTAPQVQVSNALSDAPKSDTTPPAPSNTAAVFSVPEALFGVITATVNNRAMPSENSAQASTPTSQESQPYPEISTPVVQSSAKSLQGNSDSLQVTEGSLSSTTTSADNAGTTVAPMGLQVNEKVAAGNGQATVTVTVTVTTTEKAAPVTIVSS